MIQNYDIRRERGMLQQKGQAQNMRQLPSSLRHALPFVISFFLFTAYAGGYAAGAEIPMIEDPRPSVALVPLLFF